jgi:hypothetical protein
VQHSRPYRQPWKTSALPTTGSSAASCPSSLSISPISQACGYTGIVPRDLGRLLQLVIGANMAYNLLEADDRAHLMQKLTSLMLFAASFNDFYVNIGSWFYPKEKTDSKF